MAKKANKFLVSVALIFCIIIGSVAGFFINNYITVSKIKSGKIPEAKTLGATAGEIQPELVLEEDLSIHFLELGNKYNGDCIYIKAGENDILVDAGSRNSSIPAIKDYVNTFCTDGKLEFVFATHMDRDHIACFPSNSSSKGIFESYEIDYIIDAPQTTKTGATYQNYVKYRNASDATHYTALECYNQLNGAKRVYSLGDGMELEILYNYFYDHETNDENDYSVCFMITKQVGTEEKAFIFTGDLEKEGEKKFVEKYSAEADFPEYFELYKAGHHGSGTSSSPELLNLIKPKTCVVTCVAGSTEFSNNPLKTFPTQEFIENISSHTTEVYVTSMATDSEQEYSSLNGTIVYCYSEDKQVYCSNDSNMLKDTNWFKSACEANERSCPIAWNAV